MNRIYRLIWNRALKVLQVASELTRARAGGTGQSGSSRPAGARRPLFLACAAALAVAGAGMAPPAWAASTYTVTQTSDDGTGNTVGSLSWAIAQANANPGSTIVIQLPSGGSITETGTLPSLTASTTFNGALQVLGSGAGPLVNGGTGTILQIGDGTAVTSITGSNGGTGGGVNVGIGGNGGGGGGAVTLNNGTSLSVMTHGSAVGGAGGNGGSVSSAGEGGNGGNGGNGITGSGSFTLTNAGTIAGGAGGAGGGSSGSGLGGYGGNGGTGVSGTGFSLTNSGIIAGGAGGAGGNAPIGGNGGNGGTAVSGSGFTLTNQAGGQINGGAAGAGGGGSIGGYGGGGGTAVVSTGNSHVTNAGSISGSTAVSFSGGGNTLTLEVGSTTTGSITSSSGSTNGGDTLTLGDNASGGGSDSLNVGSVSGFSTYQKTGTSTWTLTGAGSNQNWLLQQGTLQIGGGISGSIAGSNGSTGGGTSNGIAGNGSGGGNAVTAGNGTTLNVMANGSATGGAGGTGGSAGNGLGGNGGNGGAGITGSGSFTLTNAGTLAGGAGGAGGNNSGAGFGGNGGNGGTAVSGTGFSLTNSGTIAGGAGGAGGSAPSAIGGNGGNGGNAASGSGFTLTNQAGGQINGGAAGGNGGGVLGGYGGSGGTAVVSTGNSHVTNAGSISGSTAVSFSGGGNTLTLEVGSTTTGSITSSSGSTNGGDTLTLGDNASGGGSDSLNVGSVSGFSTYQKTGTSTWTLTGAGSNQNWLLQQGTLQGDATAFGGNIAFAPAAGNTASVVFDQGSGNINSPATATYAGVISGNGSLTKIDDGTLILTGANTYSGGTTISGGTLQGDTTSLQGNIADNASLVFDQNVSGTFAGIISGTGSLTQSGSGTLTLAGANTYSGGTTVSAGALQVGDGGLLGSGNVDVDSATLIFNQSASSTFSNDLSLTGGSLAQNGPQILTLNGAVTASGASTFTVNHGSLQFGDGTLGSFSDNAASTINLNGNVAVNFDLAGDTTVAGSIIGAGSLTQIGSGTLTLDGNSGSFTGSTEVRSGGLIVGSVAGNGALLGGNVTVDSGASLAGHGTIGGDVTLASGAHLAPGNSIGTLTVNGNFTAANGSVFDYEFGAPGPSFVALGSGDSVTVGGNLELDGATLNVTDAGGFGPGLYNLFTYGGTLTETHGGITLGTTPAGDSLSIQYLTGNKQINLLNTTGLTLNFWNANGLASATQMGGGSGVWSTTAPNWTDATGDVSAPMNPQPGFAIFGGAAGTVTVDGNGGANPVSALGMQFASNGYTLTGDTLTLVGSNGSAPVIRVGDGSAGSAGFTATIANVLAGTDGLTKTDLGTLVLTGLNTYSGGTTISGGELSVASDANLGDASGSLTLDGGMLQVTGTAFNSTARTIALGNLGGGFDIADAGNTFTVAQALSGSGGLTKAGAGTLVLTGANTYSGGTTISAGTLQGDTTSLQGDIADNAALVFDQNGTGTFAGTITGSGTLAQNGGVLILTGDSSYTGGTTVSGGTLQLGNGGTTGSITGDVTENGALVFDRSDTVDFGGAISGSGSLTQNGAGTLVLSGANTYSGGTTVSAGTLQGDTTSLQGDIADNAALVFDQGADGTFAGAVSGTGSLTKTGTGTLVLSGANTYSGGTTVNAGTLQGDTTSLQGDIADNAALVFDQGADGTFAGAVSGTGSLTKTGAGMLVLSGANTYSGGTTVSAGTLQGDTTSLQGDIADNAALVFDQGADGTFAGAVSGSGSLTKTGAGTLVLSGANTYSGGTTIGAGTLQGDTASLQGSIADNAALVFNQNADGIFTGSVSGSGVLTKNGTGMLVLDGSNPFAGTTNVQAGTLEVGDAHTPSAFLGGNVQVAAGGTLRGHGTIGGNVINNGNLWAGGSIGTLAIQGNYTQSAGSTITVDALPTGQASLLTVGGSASILGGNTLVLAQSGNWAPQTDYTILTAAGGVSGQFASATSSLTFLSPVLTYTAHAVDLSLQRNDISFASVAQTPNQRATAAAADSLGFGSAVYGALTLLDAPTARHAFDQLSGVIYPSTRTALIDDSRYVRDTINRHLLGLNNDGSEGATAAGVSVWTSAWGHGGHADGTANAALLQQNGSGLLVGADLPLGTQARLGAVLGHGQNSIQSSSVGSSAHVLGNHAGLYGSGAFGSFALRAGAVYSWQDVHSNRTVAFGNYSDWLTSEHHAQTAQAYVEGGYQFNVGPGQQLEPFVNLARVRVHEDALREVGGAAALAVAADSTSVNTATLGLRDTVALDAAGGVHAHASIGWQRAWGGLTPLNTMRFLGGGDSFAIAGMPLAGHAVTADLGIDFKLAKNVTVGASYLGQFASGVQDQGARMSLTVAF